MNVILAAAAAAAAAAAKGSGEEEKFHLGNGRNDDNPVRAEKIIIIRVARWQSATIKKEKTHITFNLCRTSV
jgi:hypothetical protein